MISSSSIRPITSLELFYRELRRIPHLNREEEQRLARLWRDKHDFYAVQQLIMSNLHVAAAIAREYRHFGLPEEDLIQEGTIGLMQALKNYDPERGFRLATYAPWWIRAAIHEYILRSWSIVKIGTNKLQRRVFAGLQKARHAIAAIEGKDIDEVAAQYNISPDSYQSIANAFLQRDVSLDADRDGRNMIIALPGPQASPEDEVAEKDWRHHQQEELQVALRQLSDRDRYIIEQRYLHEPPSTLKALAGELGVSIERVRQLESRAIRQMREKLTS